MRTIRTRPLRALLGAAPLAMLLLLSACTEDQSTIDPASDFTEQVNEIYVIVAILAGIVFVGVLGATLGFAIWFRERPGREARQFHGNARLEVIWTLVPVAIVAAISIPTFNAIRDTTADELPDGALQVIATGHQWWFEFEYPELGITTANELHLPVDRAVNVTLLSDDVIHSFWIPKLVGKTDMVPGHENSLWFTPNQASAEPFLGQCAEFCGTSHANMRFRAFVDTTDDFDSWVATQLSDGRAADEDLSKRGEEIFLANACIGCHTVKGTIAAGTIGPDLTHLGGRSTIASGIMANTPENLARWIRNPDDPKPGALMPSFGDVLSEDELTAVVAYLLSLE